MKRSEFMRKCGTLKVGARFEMVSGPQTGTILEITNTDAVDPDGFSAVQIRFSTGEIETVEKSIFADMLDGKFEHICKVVA